MDRSLKYGVMVVMFEKLKFGLGTTIIILMGVIVILYLDTPKNLNSCLDIIRYEEMGNISLQRLL